MKTIVQLQAVAPTPKLIDLSPGEAFFFLSDVARRPQLRTGYGIHSTPGFTDLTSGAQQTGLDETEKNSYVIRIKPIGGEVRFTPDP